MFFVCAGNNYDKQSFLDVSWIGGVTGACADGAS